MDRYQGKTVLITGGTTGIGLATAKFFVGEGARVIVTGRTPLGSPRLSKGIQDGQPIYQLNPTWKTEGCQSHICPLVGAHW